MRVDPEPGPCGACGVTRSHRVRFGVRGEAGQGPGEEPTIGTLNIAICADCLLLASRKQSGELGQSAASPTPLAPRIEGAIRHLEEAFAEGMRTAAQSSGSIVYAFTIVADRSFVRRSWLYASSSDVYQCVGQLVDLAATMREDLHEVDAEPEGEQ